MSVEWRYDPTHDLVCERCAGSIERQDVLSVVSEQREQVEPGPATKYLFDYREWDSDLSPVDLRILGRLRAHGRDGRRVGPHAIVADTDVRYGMARMLQAYFEFYSAPHANEMRVFRCIDEARRWLDLDGLQIAV